MKKKKPTKRFVPKPGETVYKIKWKDHFSTDSGWKYIEAVDDEPIVNTSIGFFVKEGKETLTLAQNKDPYGKVADTVCILKNCITERKRIG